MQMQFRSFSSEKYPCYHAWVNDHGEKGPQQSTMQKFGQTTKDKN